MITICITNQKGGCAKTTTSISLAAGLAEKGYTVTVVDLDSQMNATQSFGLESEDLDGELTIADAFLNEQPASRIVRTFPDRYDGRLSVLPGSRGVTSIESRFDARIQQDLAAEEITLLDADDIRNKQRRQLKTSLESLHSSRDFVIIDTPPLLGFMMMTGLIAADHYLIPLVPSGYDLRGLKQLIRNSNQIKDVFSPQLGLLGVLLTKTKGTNLDKDIRKMLAGTFEKGVIFKTEISDSVRHREVTLTKGVSIHEHAPGETASKQYLALADDILKRVGNPAAKKGAKKRNSSPLLGKSKGDTPKPLTDMPAEAVGG